MRTVVLALALLGLTVGCGSENSSTISDEYKNSVRSPETNPKTPISAGQGDNAAAGVAAPPVTAP